MSALGADIVVGLEANESPRADRKPGARWLRSLRFFRGLRGLLLALTVVFVLLAEMLIFPPSVAAYRNNWLSERIQAAEIAAIALEAAPDRMLSDELSRRLMEETQLIAVAVGKDDMRELIFSPQMNITSQPVLVDLRNQTRWNAIWSTFDHMLAPEGRFLRIIDSPDMGSVNDVESYVDVILPEAALKRDLLLYSGNIVLLSLLISALAGGLVYLAVYRLVVRPMIQITREVEKISQSPENIQLITPSGREDEIGRAETALKDMQEAVTNSFQQKNRLAALGEAVAKISHDLRNSLAAAQLASETLERSDDPRVQRTAPRLERAITRAINLAQSTLQYGRAEPVKPNMQLVRLWDVIDEAMREGLSVATSVDWINEVDENLDVVVDHEHLHRIVANLTRNAGQAISEAEHDCSEGLVTVRAQLEPNKLTVEIEDNGPGIPDHVQARLFSPFSASGSKNGSGLGLAIARELARAMGGDLLLTRTNIEGTLFELVIAQQN